MQTKEILKQPVLITRGLIVFPDANMDIEVGREKSINSIQMAYENDEFDKEIVLISQKNPQIEEPEEKDVYKIGTLCLITKHIKNEDGSININVKGLKRIQVTKLYELEKALYCDYIFLKDSPNQIKDIENKIQLLISMIERNLKNFKESEIEFLKKQTMSVIKANNLIYKVSSIAPINFEQKQAILETNDIIQRIDILLSLISNNKDRELVDLEINNKINKNMSKQQREYFLREKLRTVKEQLGEINSHEKDYDDFKARVEKNPYPKHIKDRVLSELSKIDSTSPQESSITKAYIEWLLNLPWWQESKDNNDIQHVEDVLNSSHYGLEKVKERIVEYLAIRTRNPKSKSPIICLVGPPGVGKSTLAKSIADALNKKFVKMSLGGVRDEAEIRGHRKTYIGAMPGRIIKAMKQAEVINPLFLLDELDKMTNDFHGDPSAALLEVLDPEQNNRFSDNYIEEYYDLSNVMFVATANYLESIPAPLYDRLEIIELTSYTENEKLEIAKKYLIPRIRQEAKISEQELSFDDEAILKIIRNYTLEAGVRELYRLIQKIARKFVVLQQHKKIENEKITLDSIIKYLKKEIFDYNVKDEKNISGIVNGMAYTSAGGDLLPIEVTWFKGKGKVDITGNLKETMTESAQVALAYVKANAKEFGISGVDFSKIDLHIHVPSGGIPKDGPSAGVTMTTAIISSLSNRPIPTNVAMTGEITLRGKVGIIGGVKEKIISAYRGGVNEIFIPSKDERYLEDVPKDILDKIHLHMVDNYKDIYNSLFK